MPGLVKKAGMLSIRILASYVQALQRCTDVYNKSEYLYRVDSAHL